jgi:hypothetical protein
MIPVRFRWSQNCKIMTLDVEKYLSHLDGYDMTHQQKVDFINALQQFAQMFVDAAWDFDPNNPTHVCIQKCAEELKDERSRQNSDST